MNTTRVIGISHQILNIKMTKNITNLKKRVHTLEEKNKNIDRVIFQKKIENFFNQYGVMSLATFIAILTDRPNNTNPEQLIKLKEMGADRELKEIFQMAIKLRKEGKL